LYVRFTPVYSNVTCRFKSTKLEDLQLGTPGRSPTTFTLGLEMACDNPNPYSLTLERANEGGIFIGTDRTQVGSLSQEHSEESRMPADGTGSMWMSTTVELSGRTLSRLLPELTFSQGAPMFVELNMQLAIDIKTLLGNWQVSKPFHKECGMRIASLISLIGNSRARLGPMACADSFEELQVPPLQESDDHGELAFSAVHMAPEEVARGKALKDAALGTAMGVAYFLGLALLALSGWCCFRRYCGRAQGKNCMESESSESCTESHSSSSA